MTARDTAMMIWYEHLETPYRWGGDDPEGGFDCSGLVIEGLKSVGVLPRKGDWKAVELLNRFRDRPRVARNDIRRGMLVFWERTKPDGTLYIGHVEIVFRILEDGTILTIGASGGGSKTLTREDAVRQNAFVRIRPLVEPYAAVIDPF